MMGKEGSRAWLSVWVALLRVIRQKRNEILFRNEVLSFVDLRIRLQSLNLVEGKYKTIHLFLAWMVLCPASCISNFDD